MSKTPRAACQTPGRWLITRPQEAVSGFEIGLAGLAPEFAQTPAYSRSHRPLSYGAISVAARYHEGYRVSPSVV
jgi:hypothetical protein